MMGASFSRTSITMDGHENGSLATQSTGAEASC